MIHIRKILDYTIKGMGAANSMMHGVGAMSLLILMGLTVVNIVLRYARMPMIWWLEVALLLFLMSIFLCWGYTTRVEEHVRAVFVLSKLPVRIQTTLTIIYSILSIGIFVFIAVGGITFALRSFQMHEVTDTLNVPLYPFKLLIPLGALLVVFELLVHLIREK